MGDKRAETKTHTHAQPVDSQHQHRIVLNNDWTEAYVSYLHPPLYLISFPSPHFHICFILEAERDSQRKKKFQPQDRQEVCAKRLIRAHHLPQP